MKNILIPTTLKDDAIKAVKTAVRNGNGDSIKIVLLMFSEMPGGITDLLFAPQSGYELSLQEQQVLDDCRKYVRDFDRISLNIHHQYGVTAPLLRNIMDHHGIGLTILTPSYKAETNYIHLQTVQILENSKCPILHLTDKVEELALDQAIFVENAATHLSMKEIQLMLKQEFAIRVVSQAKIDQNHSIEELSPVLAETIEKNNISLLVETRKTEKRKIGLKKKNNQNSLAELLGVPVLSVSDN